ncbi:hypothetical protein M2164_003833 [Streptomyces sp. SAI-208]|uniref:hypothetical protein n=1 Tax=unclassified Streptomyces TaxID=2593676 RepID=UPI0024751B44|nr:MULTISPECIES: hypothetical protein [unclassified Streptomyces]MDH6517382.1 hypothetical protein [Streptomyces sp. SAI-090]MDH6549603.1 hypothetical protein [Streptomyces sp. SAI-041]MDH6568661.1 hypothetical protein [Streptomyces sp. SAI-117]MDH6586390.1 hypothetical protein [Streptomyces sp. SAI-133]MDH6608198.1 hypothetical protein [Streptomyces sp. SAI-208]
MRGGLTEPGPTRPDLAPARGIFQAASTAVAVLAALALFVSACATGGTGTRDEGPAHAVAGTGASPSVLPSALASPRLDRERAVALLKSDPKVSEAVKRDLEPCGTDQYPVDLFYGDLTGGAADDVVVNVVTCADLVGVGSYVYREEDGSYQNVFQTEEPPVYAEIDRGDLVVTKQVYEKGDPVSDPSGENVITYRWVSGRFAAVYRTHSDYGSVGTEPSPAPDS